MQLKRGTLVVLEGLDATGKSTQLEALRGLLGNEYYTHSPSGSSKVGELVYALTETRVHMTPLGRQFLHLAAAAEEYEKAIIPALATGGVIMDRCWWSTIAYGWYGGGLKHLIDLPDFIKMVRLPTQDVMPTVVFCFMHAYEQDEHNTAEVLKGYEFLALDAYPEVMEPIDGDYKVDEVTIQIMAALKRRNLLEN